MGNYRVAQICMNGHVITDSADAYPQHKENFCSTCGKPTIMSCPECDTPIRGDYYVTGFGGSSNYKKPLYCHNCGKPYPWTKTILDTAQEIIEYDEKLSSDEKVILQDTITDIVNDSPKTQLATSKYKSVISKALSNTGDALKQILIEIASETAKKTLFPDT